MKNIIYILAILIPFFIFAKDKQHTSAVPDIKPAIAGPANIYPLSSIQSGDEKIQTFDVNKDWCIIPAGKFSAIKFNQLCEKLENYSPELGLSETVLAAIKTAPKWVRPALTDNLRRIAMSRRESFGQMIATAEVNVRDEIAFQLAHLAPQTLNSIDPRIITQNAEYIYTIAPDLQYVQLVERQNSADDWHTTTKYRVIKDGVPVWVEIPSDIYYWWIVMPKLSDEEPLMNLSVYNEFWRKHVYYTADQGYPLLKDALKDVTLMWDCQPHHWDNEDTAQIPIPFGDSLFAVQAVARWSSQNLPQKAQDPRPVQPNQILHDHNGNCGENQDLLNAGARTALLPVLSLGSWPGDHVWNELWWEGEWWYYQVSWDSGPTDLNQTCKYLDKGLITAQRGDAYYWMVNEHYNPVCTLTVRVLDSQNKPVDGAQVTFFSATYRSPKSDTVSLGSWGYTDVNGELTVKLGANITYGMRADWAQGHDPAPSNSIYIIRYNQTTEGAQLGGDLHPGGSVPSSVQANKITGTGSGTYKLTINYDAPYRILYGGGYWQASFPYDDYQWSDFREQGAVDFYICDNANYQKYLAGSAFDSYEVRKNTASGNLEFSIPSAQDFYIIFDNKGKNIASQLIQSKIELYKQDNEGWSLIDTLNPENIPTGIDFAENTAGILLNTAPNPVSEFAAISYKLTNPETIDLSIYDFTGRKVKTLFNGKSDSSDGLLYWDCTDESGHKAGSGIYFIRLAAGNKNIAKKIIVFEE